MIFNCFMKKMGDKKDDFHLRLLHLLFDRPILKFIILALIQIILFNLSGYFPKDFFMRWFTIILTILIAIYFIAVIVHVMRRSLKHLMNPKSLISLIGAYCLFIFVILIIASILYNATELSGLGYIKYGACSSQFNSSMISSDPLISRDFFYFSAVTFFTIGYGDICPMGVARVISILVGFVGHLISVLLVALIINNYLRKREERYPPTRK
jgi:potassium channel LctB